MKITSVSFDIKYIVHLDWSTSTEIPIQFLILLWKWIWNQCFNLFFFRYFAFYVIEVLNLNVHKNIHELYRSFIQPFDENYLNFIWDQIYIWYNFSKSISINRHLSNILFLCQIFVLIHNSYEKILSFYFWCYF